MTTQGMPRNGRQQESQPVRTHWSTAGLRARGWTATMVRQLLGEPDLLRPHPLFRTARQIRLYRVERITEAERGDEFRALAAAAARRGAAARTAALRRRRANPGASTSSGTDDRLNRHG